MKTMLVETCRLFIFLPDESHSLLLSLLDIPQFLLYQIYTEIKMVPSNNTVASERAAAEAAV